MTAQTTTSAFYAKAATEPSAETLEVQIAYEQFLGILAIPTEMFRPLPLVELEHPGILASCDADCSFGCHEW